MAGFLLLSGCGEGPLLPETSVEKVVLQFPQGGFFSRESILPLKVLERGRSNSSWTDFEAKLLDPSGRTLWTWRGLYSEGPDFSLEIPKELDNIKQGDLLELKVSVFDRRVLLSEGKVIFFLVDNLPALSGTTHPMTVYPGSRVLLDLLDAEPWKGKTWVRWSWDDRIVREGPWASTAQFRWDTPKAKDGAYALKAEVFPQAPARGTFPFSSPLVLDFPVTASSLEPVNYGPKELKPDSSYFFLYHFRGNLRDTGTSGDPAAFPEWNGLDIGLDQGVFGVRFQPGSGLTREGSPFPLNEKGEVQAFSMAVSGVLGKEPEGSLYRLASAEEKFVMELSLKEGSWILSWVMGDRRETYRKPYTPQETFSQTLSYMPHSEGAEVLWFHGPDLMSVSQITWTKAPVLQKGGLVTIGGEKGFRGVLDEIGLYYKDATNRPSADGRLLERHLKSMESGNLIWAAGFDGSYLDEGFTASQGMLRSRGRAILPQGEWLDSPVIEDLSGGFLVTLPADSAGNYRLSLVDSQGKVTESVLGSDELSAGRGGESQIQTQVAVLFGSGPKEGFAGALVKTIDRPEYDFRLRLEALPGADAVFDYIICEKISLPAEGLEEILETPPQP